MSNVSVESGRKRSPHNAKAVIVAVQMPTKSVAGAIIDLKIIRFTISSTRNGMMNA